MRAEVSVCSLLTRLIKRELIAQQDDEIVQDVTAVRLGTAESEAILRCFTRTAVQHPAYRAMTELGKVDKTLFLCEDLRPPMSRLNDRPPA